MTEKTCLLVVDDNALNRRVLCKILHGDGYETVEAENGRAALDKLADPQYKIALVLLDLVMPVMDGYAMLSEMNESGMIASTPVIVTTGSGDNCTEIRCLENGASDFLTKPYNPDLVRHRVGSMLRLCENVALISKLEFDSLTGVYNKDFFYHHVEKTLAEHADTNYMLICSDISNFKVVNEKYGISAGNELLKYIANSLRMKIARTGGFCGRIGADTFAFLCPECDIPEQTNAGLMMRESLKCAPVKNVVLKFGIYHIEDRTMPASAMYDRAQMALSTIKHRYNRCYSVYDERIHKQMLWEHQLYDAMEQGLNERQFVMYLQPKHDVNNSKIVGAEALVRWIHPTLGFISPGDFIPLFERNGFITRLDRYMWEDVCRLLNRWQSEGRPLIPISVNASRADFDQDDLPEIIGGLTDRYGIPHEAFHLEVTESAYTDNPQQIISSVSELRALGFKIEMDDFGSGYSSLNMLSDMPIDILKLDMRFMQRGKKLMDGHKESILSFVISLSKWLQLPTVAEGVESRNEVDLLKSMGCNYIQGYFFAKPMPVKDFEDYMSKCATQEPTTINLPMATEQEPGFEVIRVQRDRTVLVVEDIETNRELLRMLLEPYYTVVTAANGAEAYRYITDHRDTIDAILLDLLMPVMDGFQLLDLLRREGLLEQIPVIITSEAGSGSELRALRLGAESFVAKHYDPELLLHHVQHVLFENEYRREKMKLEMENQSLYDKACRDELTGLLNRHGLKKAMSRVPADELLTVMMIDLDNLKVYNDTMGHAFGDEALQMVGNSLRKATRTGDIVARVGGDEFIIVLRQMSDEDVAIGKGHRICASIAQCVVPGTNKHLSCSIGAAVTDRTETIDRTYQRADMALYEAKRHHKGDCVLYTAETAQAATNRTASGLSYGMFWDGERESGTSCPER